MIKLFEGGVNSAIIPTFFIGNETFQPDLPSIEVTRQNRSMKKEEIIMKIRTKLTIAVVAILLSLAGFGIVANNLSVDRIMAGATPTTEIGVSITG